MSGVRQLIWRQKGEQLGDPLVTNQLPTDRTTALHWTSTTRTAADCLTESMNPGSLSAVMDGLVNHLTPENIKECENKEEH